jgi:hypothetical protein
MRCPRCGSGQIGECPEPMAQGCATAVPLPGLRQAAQRVHRHRAGPGPLPGRRHAVAVLWRLRYRLSLRDLPARRRAVGPLDGLLPSAAQFDLAADVLALRHPQELLDGAADVLRPRRQRHPPVRSRDAHPQARDRATAGAFSSSLRERRSTAACTDERNLAARTAAVLTCRRIRSFNSVSTACMYFCSSKSAGTCLSI